MSVVEEVKADVVVSDVKQLSPFEFWNKLGCPKKVVAPMVDHSDLAYRMMTRKYGADLVYTQMFNANSFVAGSDYRDANFTTCKGDRPLIVQFAGHDPEMLLTAAKLVEDRCDAVDINLGCPQMIAKRGRYGAFLMEELELLDSLVRTLSNGLKIPVFCKTRIYKDFDRSIRLCETLVNAGAVALTIHGRTRDEKGQHVREADWDMIRRIKEHFLKREVPIPVMANGGVETVDDVYRCIKITGVDGVMSSEAILENPALFSKSMSADGVYQSQIDLTEEYLDFASTYPVRHMKGIRSHVMKMLFRYSTVHTELRDMCGEANTIEGFRDLCKFTRNLVADRIGASVGEEGESYRAKEDREYPTSYYRRYARQAEGGLAPINPKEGLLELKSSFLCSSVGDEGADLWQLGEDEENCSIFGSFFASE